MRVLVCVVLLVALAVAEPPLYRPLKVDFEVSMVEEFNEHKEGPKTNEERPYSAAGYKPVREFKIPSRFEEVRRPSLRQKLPSYEQHNFRKAMKPHLNYGVPEEETDKRENFERKEHKSKRKELVSSNKASPSAYGPPKKDEGEEKKNERLQENLFMTSEEIEGNSEESKHKVVESKENSEESKENSKESNEKSEKYHEKTEEKKNKNIEKDENGEKSEEKESGKKHSHKKEQHSTKNTEEHEGMELSTENKFKGKKESSKEENIENKEPFEKSNGKKEIEIKQYLAGGIEDNVEFKPSGPFYIVVKSTPGFNAVPLHKEAQALPYGALAFQNPAQFPSDYKAVPFQRQIDLSNVGYSSYFQQRAVDSSPFSYYFQPKLQQNPYFLPYGNQWGNQW